MVFTDRVEVWNSGSLPPELTIEDLKKPHTSFPANPLIANALYLADYVQRAGSGTLEMIEQCRIKGAPESDFVLIRNVEFRTVLARDMYTEAFFEQSGLNDRQRQAVKLIKQKGVIGLSDLQAIFPGINRWTLIKICKPLPTKVSLKPKAKEKAVDIAFEIWDIEGVINAPNTPLVGDCEVVAMGTAAKNQEDQSYENNI